MLKNNTTLLKLSFAGAESNDNNNFYKIIDSLKYNSTLQTLNLDMVCFNENDLELLKDALKVNKSLISLDLSYIVDDTNIDYNNISTFFDFLKENNTFKN